MLDTRNVTSASLGFPKRVTSAWLKGNFANEAIIMANQVVLHRGYIPHIFIHNCLKPQHLVHVSEDSLRTRPTVPFLSKLSCNSHTNRPNNIYQLNLEDDV
jgi:hypothetical protein